MRKVPLPDDDPGSRICGHDHRIHYLGGGIWVCFACVARLCVGSQRRAR